MDLLGVPFLLVVDGTQTGERINLNAELHNDGLANSIHQGNLAASCGSPYSRRSLYYSVTSNVYDINAGENFETAGERVGRNISELVERLLKKSDLGMPMLQKHQLVKARLLITMWVGICVDTLHAYPIGSRKVNYLVLRFIQSIKEKGFETVVKNYQSLILFLRRCEPPYRGSWLDLIYAELNKEVPEWYDPEFGIVRQLVYEFLANGRIDSFADVNTICAFPKRLNLERDDLNEECTEKYLMLEQQCPTQKNHDSRCDILIRSLNAELKYIISKIEYDPYEPGVVVPSSGAVSELSGKDNNLLLKLKLLSGRDCTHYNYRVPIIPEVSTLQPFIGDSKLEQRWSGNRFEHLLDRAKYKKLGLVPSRLHRKNFLVDVAKFLTVPKAYNKVRGISKEPAANVIGQLDISEWYSRNILLNYRNGKKYSYFHFDRYDQTINQELAIKGSRSTYGCATGDMSDASDLVSNYVVRGITEGTEFATLFQRYRTSKVQVGPDKVLAMRKYGGMGNGLTFPVLGTVISLTIRVAFRAMDIDPDVRKDWSVYGDDFIVPRKIFALTCQYLQILGLKVNTEKSYSNCWFRESCGVEAFKGVDVTPLNIPRFWRTYDEFVASAQKLGSKTGPVPEAQRKLCLGQAVISSTALHNRALCRGYYTLAGVLKNHLRTLPYKKLGYPGLLYGPVDYNYPTGWLWTENDARWSQTYSRDLQRLQQLCYTEVCTDDLQLDPLYDTLVYDYALMKIGNKNRDTDESLRPVLIPQQRVVAMLT